MPRFIVYHGPTTLYLRTWLIRNRRSAKGVLDDYASAGAAKAALTRVVKAHQLSPAEARMFNVLDAGFFHEHVEHKEVRHGIVGAAGKEFTVGVNESWTSGPWSETYWCS